MLQEKEVYAISQDQKQGYAKLIPSFSKVAYTSPMGMYFPIYLGPMLIIDNVIIDKVEKKYSFIPAGYGEGISGPDVTKVKYEEVTGSRNEYLYVCTYLYKLMSVHLMRSQNVFICVKLEHLMRSQFICVKLEHLMRSQNVFICVKLEHLMRSQDVFICVKLEHLMRSQNVFICVKLWSI